MLPSLYLLLKQKEINWKVVWTDYRASVKYIYYRARAALFVFLFTKTEPRGYGHFIILSLLLFSTKVVFGSTKIDFQKKVFAFAIIWDNWNYWSTKNYFSVDRKIKALLAKISLHFLLLLNIFRLTQNLPPLQPHFQPSKHHPY